MTRLITGVTIIIGGLLVTAASAANDDSTGIMLGIGFVIMGALIGGSARR